MKKLSLPKGTDDMISHPHRNKNLLRIRLTSTQIIAANHRPIRIFLGVEENVRIGMPWLSLYYYSAGPSGSEEVEMDQLHYAPEHSQPFYWIELEPFEGQLRCSVKKRLRVLGFNPKVVDRIFPRQERNTREDD